MTADPRSLREPQHAGFTVRAHRLDALGAPTTFRWSAWCGAGTATGAASTLRKGRREALRALRRLDRDQRRHLARLPYLQG